jgi:PAS domain S-box-containing protein
MPLVVENAQAHPLFELAQVDVPKRFRSLVLMPIRFEDKAMGVLFLRFEEPYELTEDDDVFLRAIANATGIALRNASLLHNLRDQSMERRDAHVEAERQLKALQRYVDFFDSCADGILVVTVRGEILFCNPAACVILGRGEQELSKIRMDDMLSRDGRKKYETVRASFEQGIFPNSVDLPVLTGDGRRRVLNVSFSSILREHRGVIVSLRDVTDDRATARELNKTKEFLQAVIDSSVDAIVSADMHGNVLLFNPAAERTYGYTASEVVGVMNVRDLYPPGEAKEVMRRIHSPNHGDRGILQGYETELRGKGNAAVPVMLSASLIFHRGRAVGSVGVFKDLRAKLQIEERLRTAQLDLAEKEQKAFIAELAGATAHELNQPLTAVMGYAGILEGALDGNPQLKRASGAIVRESERMAEIVRKIGKLTKYESKAYVGDTRIIDIERSIDSEPPVTGI